MMRTKITPAGILLLIVCLLLTAGCGQSPAAPAGSAESPASAAVPAESTEEPYYGIATTAAREEVEYFASEVKHAYLNRDWETLSEMVEYPVTMFGDGEVRNEEEFIQSMVSHDIPEEFFASVEQESCSDLFANGQGISMADGVIWFRDVNFDGIAQLDEPSFKIIAINIM